MLGKIGVLNMPVFLQGLSRANREMTQKGCNSQHSGTLLENALWQFLWFFHSLFYTHFSFWSLFTNLVRS